MFPTPQIPPVQHSFLLTDTNTNRADAGPVDQLSTISPNPSNPSYSDGVTNKRHHMRNIERQMIAAVKGNINWSKDNTSVIFEDGISSVYLHGNLIAEVDDDSIKLYDGGWQTATTKSRLNALLSEFGYSTEHVFQKQFEWFISIFDLTEKTMRTIPFTSGMRLA